MDVSQLNVLRNTTSIVTLEKPETLRVQSVVDAMRLGAWLRSGEVIG